jgi:hypothetical protein
LEYLHLQVHLSLKAEHQCFGLPSFNAGNLSQENYELVVALPNLLYLKLFSPFLIGSIVLRCYFAVIFVFIVHFTIAFVVILWLVYINN